MPLKSKFAKQNEIFRAQKVFTDRVEPRKVFIDSIHRFIKKGMLEENKEIITYYGKGGIGKSKLLKELYTNLSQEVYGTIPELQIKNIFLSLDAYDYSSPINVLLALRAAISGDCSLFDYALVQYYSKAKLTIEEIKSKNNFLSSSILDLFSSFIDDGICSVSLPTVLINQCVSWIQDTRFKAKYREEIAEISTLNEFEIFERLPYYLGLCVSHEAEKGHVYVVFFDSYESIVAKTAGLTPSRRGEEWLQEFFLACNQIRIFIASREKIMWDKYEPGWKEYLEQHLLQNLSDEDSRWFLEQVPICKSNGELDQRLISDIVQHADGVPLYLDMCVDIYTDAMNNGQTLNIASLYNGETIIDRYLRHLSSKDKNAVKVLSVPQKFDLDFAIKLLEKQGLIYHENELLELLEKSIFLRLENTIELWKVDESVRYHLYDQMSINSTRKIIAVILDYVLEKRNGTVFTYFVSVVQSIEKNVQLLEGLYEKLIEATDYFSNSGYWNEIHALLHEHITDSDNPLYSVSVYAELIRLRRTASLSEAETFASSHPLTLESLGVWNYLYRYLQIQIRHLQGFYDESLENYRSLMNEMQLVRSIIPSHIYNVTAMKYADLLFLKGDFNESLIIIEELLNRPDTILVDKIELIRIKGHIYRFNHKYIEASIIYKSAMDLIKNHGLYAYEGKLYTNMAEVCCTTKPDVALSWYEKAIVENAKTHNDIEIGKAHAAGSVANTVLGNYKTAIDLANQSIAIAEKTGYKAGGVFGLTALYYAELTFGTYEKASETLDILKKQIKDIGVYEYILNYIS